MYILYFHNNYISPIVPVPELVVAVLVLMALGVNL